MPSMTPALKPRKLMNNLAAANNPILQSPQIGFQSRQRLSNHLNNMQNQNRNYIVVSRERQAAGATGEFFGKGPCAHNSHNDFTNIIQSSINYTNKLASTLGNGQKRSSVIDVEV
jgi:hypothetical protein